MSNIAHHADESAEQREAHIAALEAELAVVKGQDREGEVQGELDRVQGQRRGKQTRAAAESDAA
jgi:hypothetical protein